MVYPERGAMTEFWSNKSFDTFEEALEYARCLEKDWEILSDNYVCLAQSRYGNSIDNWNKRNQFAEHEKQKVLEKLRRANLLLGF